MSVGWKNTYVAEIRSVGILSQGPEKPADAVAMEMEAIPGGSRVTLVLSSSEDVDKLVGHLRKYQSIVWPHRGN